MHGSIFSLSYCVGMRFSEATAALLHCNRTAFQPAELFPLFPLYSAPWAGRLPQQRHWGLHPPLPDLHALATRCGAGRDGYDVEGAVLGATRCCVDYLMQVGVASLISVLVLRDLPLRLCRMLMRSMLLMSESSCFSDISAALTNAWYVSMLHISEGEVVSGE